MDKGARGRVAFNTLGCKLNQYETDALASRFIHEGYEIVPFDGPADAYIVNTCTVTNKADRKTRNSINRALKLSGKLESLEINGVGAAGIPATPASAPRPVTASVRSSGADPGGASGSGPDAEAPAAAGTVTALSDNAAGSIAAPADSRTVSGGGNGADRDGGAMVVVTGCFVDSHKAELEADGRSFVVDNERKNSIFELVDAHLKGEIVHLDSLKGDRFHYDASQQVFRTRGMVKIQDGCDNFCSFCIIPYVRGTAISRDPAEVIASASQMLDDGYRELVLTGVNMSRYRHGDWHFSDLVEKLLELDGDWRLRISSIEPDQIDDKFIGLMKHPRMTPHLHLCLQSGSEKILLKMRRQYTRLQFDEIVSKLRRALPDFNITTDIIVGFPGEDEDEFNRSLEAVNTLGFGHVHAFKYSVRQGTRAERMDGHVKESVKSERSERLRLAAEDAKRRYRLGFIGRTQRVLVERVQQDTRAKNEGIRQDTRVTEARGLGQHYLPLRFTLPAGRDPELFINEYVDVRITGIEDGEDPQLLAEIEP